MASHLNGLFTAKFVAQWLEDVMAQCLLGAQSDVSVHSSFIHMRCSISVWLTVRAGRPAPAGAPARSGIGAEPIAAVPCKPFAWARRGIIQSLAGRKLGRIYADFTRQNTSANVMCWAPKHTKCKKWTMLADVPGEDLNRCALWISKQGDYESAETHLAAWKDIVLAPPAPM